MTIRWSPDAEADLESIVDYIRRDSADAAQRTGRSIYDRVQVLARFPRSGKHGRVGGTREFGLAPLPYLVVYRVDEQNNEVRILNVIHGAQRWPPPTD